MPVKSRLLAHIDNAAGVVTPVWPLRRFIATNPLAGFEDLAFPQAVARGARQLGGRGLPDRAMGRRALAAGEINPAVLETCARRRGQTDLLATMLQGPLAEEPQAPSSDSPLNRLSIKWLAAFLDEGQAAWPMPGRERGFYRAWKALAVADAELPDPGRLKALPDEALDALLVLLRGLPETDHEALLANHLAALPGWAGFVRWRANQTPYIWQQVYPISLADYLAVRLAMAWLLGDALAAPALADPEPDPEGLLWLEAWEESYRENLLAQLRQGQSSPLAAPSRVAVQLVFCIDVRSELLRRHLEASGPYQTLGFAGFFGIPVAFRGFIADEDTASCPVLLEPRYTVGEQPLADQQQAALAHRQGSRHLGGLRALLGTLKSNIAAPFAYVESAGSVFGLVMAARTLFPGAFQRWLRGWRDWLMPAVALSPTIHLCGADEHGEAEILGISLEEQVFYAEAGLQVMGLTSDFAALVVLCGHGGETVNNPYAAGLDCGACGGNPGGPNARIMAAIYNDPAVRTELAGRGIVIPDATRFAAAEHNTTTDEVRLFEPEALYQHDPVLLEALQQALEQARRGACAERGQRLPGMLADSLNGTRERAADWAQVRPEWGLARNAAFIVGPRQLTRGLDLQGRSFLHSYDWQNDPTARVLEVILTAPMVVAEWINTQYYFSSVDNAVYGSGSKTTHNVVGKIGVMQGNASDLMNGLALQSLRRADAELYHQPLRLMSVVQAPRARVVELIARNDILRTLFDNQWVALTVIDPEDQRWLRYCPGGEWRDVTVEPGSTPQTTESTTPALA